MRVRNVEGLSLFFWRPFTISVMVTSMNAMQIVTFRMLVKFGPLLLALCACGGPDYESVMARDPSQPCGINYPSCDTAVPAMPTPRPAVHYDGAAASDIYRIFDITQACVGRQLDLDGIDVDVYATLDELHSHCDSSGTTTACSNDKRIALSLDQRKQWPETLAHEIGHVMFRHHVGNGDHDHTAGFWFGRADGGYGDVPEHGSVADCARVAF